MEHLVRSLKVFWRSERLLSKTELRLMAQKIQYNALAGLIAVFGLVMLSLSIFFALEPYIGQALAALTIGAGDIVLAWALVAYAGSLKPSQEIGMVKEMRDMALVDIEGELARAEADLSALKDEARKFIRNPVGAILPMAIGPMVGAVAKGLRSTTKKQDESPSG